MLHLPSGELHAIVTQGDAQFRIWLPERPRFGQPVGFLLPTDNFARRCRRYAAFHAFVHGKPPYPCSRSVQLKRKQLIDGLRAIDAWHDNASYRTIATALFGEEAIAREHWKTSSRRQQVIRLIKWALCLVDGNYADLLEFVVPLISAALAMLWDSTPFGG